MEEPHCIPCRQRRDTTDREHGNAGARDHHNTVNETTRLPIGKLSSDDMFDGCWNKTRQTCIASHRNTTNLAPQNWHPSCMEIATLAPSRVTSGKHTQELRCTEGITGLIQRRETLADQQRSSHRPGQQVGPPATPNNVHCAPNSNTDKKLEPKWHRELDGVKTKCLYRLSLLPPLGSKLPNKRSQRSQR